MVYKGNKHKQEPVKEIKPYVTNCFRCDGYDMYCSKKCRKLGVVSTLNRPEVRQKINETLMKRHGTLNISLIGKEKREKTFLRKYGVDHPFKSKEIKDKAKETCITRFGCENVIDS